MNIPVLNPSNIVVASVFPPTQIAKNDLTQLYATIVKRYESYGTFAFLPPGGAKISQPGVSDILIQPERVQVSENIDNALSFQHIKEKTVEIVQLATAKIKPPIFLILGVKLMAIHDMTGTDGNSVQFMNTKMLNSFKAENLEPLGKDLQGIGLRFRIDMAQPMRMQCDLKIEPFFRDNTKLFIELDVQSHEPTPNLSFLEDRLEFVERYLRREVKEFLEQF
jgi:hypothetical protein